MNIVNQEEGRRDLTLGDSKFILQMDKNTTLWEVKSPQGPAPVPLRGRYTTVERAVEAIKNWLDNAPARKIVYKPIKKNAEE